eukprot:6119822-Prymnesium_polylepis.1
MRRLGTERLDCGISVPRRFDHRPYRCGGYAMGGCGDRGVLCLRICSWSLEPSLLWLSLFFFTQKQRLQRACRPTEQHRVGIWRRFDLASQHVRRHGVAVLNL